MAVGILLPGRVISPPPVKKSHQKLGLESTLTPRHRFLLSSKRNLNEPGPAPYFWGLNKRCRRRPFPSLDDRNSSNGAVRASFVRCAVKQHANGNEIIFIQTFCGACHRGAKHGRFVIFKTSRKIELINERASKVRCRKEISRTQVKTVAPYTPDPDGARRPYMPKAGRFNQARWMPSLRSLDRGPTNARC